MSNQITLRIANIEIKGADISIVGINWENASKIALQLQAFSNCIETYTGRKLKSIELDEPAYKGIFDKELLETEVQNG